MVSEETKRLGGSHVNMPSAATGVLGVTHPACIIVLIVLDKRWIGQSEVTDEIDWLAANLPGLGYPNVQVCVNTCIYQTHRIPSDALLGSDTHHQRPRAPWRAV